LTYSAVHRTYMSAWSHACHGSWRFVEAFPDTVFYNVLVTAAAAAVYVDVMCVCRGQRSVERWDDESMSSLFTVPCWCIHSHRRWEGVSSVVSECSVRILLLVSSMKWSHWCRTEKHCIAGVLHIVTEVTQIYTVSQKTGPLWLLWHNFTNSQHLLIIFGTDISIQFSIDTVKSFKIGLELSAWLLQQQ